MEKIQVNKQDLVKMASTLATNEGMKVKSQKDIREVLDTIEAVVKSQVTQANKETTVEVKVFNGLTVVSQYREPREARNPMTGETVFTEAKNQVKAKIGAALKDAANA